MQAIESILSSLESEHRLRSIPESQTEGMIDLSSNDYLGLGYRCNEFKEEFISRFPDVAFSSSASRLLSRHQDLHNDLENYLGSLYGRKALLFNSGYHANVGCIGGLTIPSTLFICDKLIHASIVDGLRMAGSEYKRFPHNDVAKLRMIIEKYASAYRHIVIVVESIYSMDGDEAPLKDLSELKDEYPGVFLYVDEAHAFGVRGKLGLGVAEELGLTDSIDLLIGTFGKAAASAGAFAICSEEIKSLLINCARSFIFSTALPPVNIAWSMFMTEKITGMESQRRYLSDMSHSFASRLEAISGKRTSSSSQIIPYLTGDAATALSIARRLRESGYVALPIRRPTVPPGGERIRFSLGANHDLSQLSPVFDILKEFI